MEKVTKIVVLAKQVPDTRNVGKDAMTPEGTVNRAALAAIFNPEDLNALEMALQMKDRIGSARVEVLTMGPQRAADVIREAMFRGADGGYLLSGKEFAGSDTLATSYALSCALRKINPDIIVAGRQAIDGDTAQVGPQVAEKLDLPQVTYAEELINVKQGYAQCSTVTVGENAIITQDPSIYKAATAHGIDALKISDGGVALRGYDTGFIGGASGALGSHVVFCGNLSLHADGEKISAFCQTHGKQALSLSHSPLYDYGTVFFV